MGKTTRCVLAAAVVLGVVLSGPAAWGARADSSEHGRRPAPAPTELAVSGSFTGTGTLGTECTVFHQVVRGTGVWSELGASGFTLDFCTANDQGGNHWPIYNGTFTVRTEDGSGFSGTMTGFVEAGGLGPQFPLHFTLEVTAGTGRLTGATGTIAMEGAFGFGAATVEGTVDGTLTVPPHSPASPAECRDGGWRNLVDGRGRPFHSRAQCEAWARHHGSG
jgi:hypothetical protein